MNEHVGSFKKCWFLMLEGVANPYQYRLRDFLLGLSEDAGPSEILSKAAVDFCTEEGSWNGSEIALAAIMYFMSETSTVLPKVGDEQAANDLRRLLERGAKLEEIENWAAGFYPPQPVTPPRPIVPRNRGKKS